MAKLIRVRSQKSKPTISAGLTSATSLQALPAGRLPFASLGGDQGQSGPALVHAHLFPSRVKEKRARDARVKILSHALVELASSFAVVAAKRGWPTPDIFGRNGGVFYAMPDQVARSLESRLQARLAGRGSPLYALRWRSWIMVLGAPIFAVRASEKTISGSAYTGWPTPKTVTGGANSKRKERKAGGADLQEIANLLAGWTTPQTRDHKDGATTLDNTPINGMLSRQVTLLTQSSPQRQTVNIAPYLPTKRASLNPVFSLWLILGPFATAWASCAQRVTR